jgi:hypothetical protein
LAIIPLPQREAENLQWWGVLKSELADRSAIYDFPQFIGSSQINRTQSPITGITTGS